jgi:hypothetical protein
MRSLASFKNSNVNDLKFIDSVLIDIRFDENTIFSSDISNEIFLTTSFEPVTDYFNYLHRVFKNQLVKHLGFVVDNSLSKFY